MSYSPKGFQLLQKVSIHSSNPVRSVPPSDPKTSSEKHMRLLEKECCGNFLIQGDQVSPLQLWSAGDSLQVELAQISVFNSSSSTDILEVDITGAEQVNMEVYPGNTGTFTGKKVKTIHITSDGSSSKFVEGKYTVSSSFQLKDEAS